MQFEFLINFFQRQVEDKIQNARAQAVLGISVQIHRKKKLKRDLCLKLISLLACMELHRPPYRKESHHVEVSPSNVFSCAAHQINICKEYPCYSKVNKLTIQP